MPPLIALGAQIILRSTAGTRTLALEDYFIAYGKQDRQPGEFIEKIIIPHRGQNVLFKTYKVCKRFDQDISAVCGGFALHLEGEVITQARLAYGGMAATPKRARQAEAVLMGRKWDEIALSEAMSAIAEDFAPLTDMRATAQYRSRVAQNLLARFYAETKAGETATQVYRYVE
jgi:xanthine dehydrogenase small subunit